MVGLDKTVAPAAAAAVLAVAMCDIGTMHVATEVFARKENEVDLLADLLADPMDPTDPLTTRRTRKTAGWRRNSPSLRHRGATDANGVTGLAVWQMRQTEVSARRKTRWICWRIQRIQRIR